MNFEKLKKEEAKLYNIYGRHYYYRTPSGETFSITDGYKKEYFYCGNAYTDSNEKKTVYIKHDDVPKLLEKITFVKG